MRTLCMVHENEEDCNRKISELSHLFKYGALDQTPSSRIAKIDTNGEGVTHAHAHQLSLCYNIICPS